MDITSSRKKYEKKKINPNLFFQGGQCSKKFRGGQCPKFFQEGQCLKKFQGGQLPKICSGRTTSKIYSGRTMSENVQGGQCSDGGIMSICFRESNANNRSGDSITREANGSGVIMTICFRGCNVREDFFSGRTIFREYKVSGSTSSWSRFWA